MIRSKKNNRSYYEWLHRSNLGFIVVTSLFIQMLFLTSCGSSKTELNQDIYDINAQISKVKIDQIGNIYILDKSNRLTRYNNRLEPLYTYADNTQGIITTVDVSDPLKIVIYKKDYGSLIKLDNTLAELKNLNLYELNYQSVSTVATALDGNTWIYDNAQYQLKKINDQGKELINSISMVDLGLQNIDPDFIQEKAGKLIVQDSDKGIFLFDNLGQFIQTFPIKVKENVQFDGTNIIYFQGNQLIRYNTRFFETNYIALDESKMNQNPFNILWGKTDLIYCYNRGILIGPKNPK